MVNVCRIFDAWSIWERFCAVMAVASPRYPALAQVGNFVRVRKIGNAIYGEAKNGSSKTRRTRRVDLWLRFSMALFFIIYIYVLIVVVAIYFFLYMTVF